MKSHKAPYVINRIVKLKLLCLANKHEGKKQKIIQCFLEPNQSFMNIKLNAILENTQCHSMSFSDNQNAVKCAMLNTEYHSQNMDHISECL